VRPTPVANPELLAVSPAMLQDLGLTPEAVESPEFLEVLSGNRVLGWENIPAGTKDKEASTEGVEAPADVYPYAQNYGGYQFGSWAQQLGDGRVQTLFSTPVPAGVASASPNPNPVYEVQLKGSGMTPYSRFADGKAVLRSSIREFLVSENLRALGIPTTRALALILTPENRVVRERIEPGAIVARVAESWVRFGTFDLLHARGQRTLLRQVADYVMNVVYGGEDKLEKIPADSPVHYNRYARLYRTIVLRQARTVAHWQAVGFMNGVLNTDNTSILSLSLDFGPFSFIDAFDPAFTPNHDDHSLRYSLRSQPAVIWWNCVRLGEAFGELVGAGEKVDDETFIKGGIKEEEVASYTERAEKLIGDCGQAYKVAFEEKYEDLMAKKIGVKDSQKEDFASLLKDYLGTLEECELDYSHSFRRLGVLTAKQLESKEGRLEAAKTFFSATGTGGIQGREAAEEKVAGWLERWRTKVIEEWGESGDEERRKSMEAVNPHVSHTLFLIHHALHTLRDEFLRLNFQSSSLLCLQELWLS
jgi:uncharacterized protein YdiU (UPF0061 family)